MGVGLAGLGVAVQIATLIVLPLTSSDQHPTLTAGSHLVDGAFSLLFLAYTLTGVLIAWHRPGNKVGWVLTAGGLFLQGWIAAPRYAAVALPEGPTAVPGGLAVAWLGTWFAPLGFGMALVFLPLLFPTGRLPSRRWRPVAWFSVLAVGLFAFTWAFEPGHLEPFEGVANPVSIAWLGGADFSGVGWGLFVLAIVASAASVGVRFRGATGDERQQVKWLLLAVALVVLAFVLVTAASDPGEPPSVLADILFTVSLAALPVSIGIAILRHRLLDVDVVIRRTLVYSATSLGLGGFYIACVLLIQAGLSPFTQQNALAVAVATLAAAALFRPLRARIQRGVDRRFYRSRYDAARTLEAFGARLRDELDLGSVTDELVGAAQQAMQPSSASVWLRSDLRRARSPATKGLTQ